MTTTTTPMAAREDLARIIHAVRRRWRVRVGLRGGAIVLAIASIAIILGALLVLESEGSATLLNVVRAGVVLVIAAATTRFLLMPLSRRVSD